MLPVSNTLCSTDRVGVHKGDLKNMSRIVVVQLVTGT